MKYFFAASGILFGLVSASNLSPPQCWLKGKCMDTSVQDLTNIDTAQLCLWYCKNAIFCSWYSFEESSSTCSLLETCLTIDETLQGYLTGQRDCKVNSGFTKVLVTGGFNGTSYLRETEVIDLANPDSTCKPIQDFPIDINFASGALWRMNQPVVCGSYEKSNECYVLENGSWNPGPPMEFGRYGHVMLASANNPEEAIVSGGFGLNGDLDSQEILTKNGWKKFVALPEPMMFHCMVQITDTTYGVVGGMDSHGNRNKAWTLNVETGSWFEGHPFPVGRRGMSCATMTNSRGGQSILAIGGIEYEGVTSSVLVIDLDTVLEGWYAGPSLPQPVFSAEVVYDQDGGIVLLGGFTGVEVLNTVYKLSNLDSEWVKMDRELKHKRTSPVAISVPNTLVDCA